MNESVRVLITNTEGAWVAQCLEHDICVQADTIDALQKRFETVMFCERDSLASIDAAPAEFFEQWDAAHELSAHFENVETRLAA